MLSAAQPTAHKSGAGRRSPWRWAAVLSAAVSVSAALPGLAQEATPAPLNSQFVEFQKKLVKPQFLTPMVNLAGYTLGYVPPPVDLSHLTKARALSVTPETAAALPSSYDLRTTSKVSPVKNQLMCGDCWAFATFGSMESSLLPAETWNFSENNLNNLSGFDTGRCNGGNGIMSTAYLARWAGPVSGFDDPDPTQCTSTSTCYNNSPSGARAKKHTQDVIFLPSRQSSWDTATLKNALMTWGAVDVSMSASALGHTNLPYWNASTAAYYYNGDPICGGECDINHSVTLVGWDDNYAVGNFNAGKLPPGPGAFLVKNSWGTNFGNSGFFWVSYYDVWFAYGSAFVFSGNASAASYTAEYQYDPLGTIGGEGYGSTSGWLAAIYTATDSNPLLAVSTYALADNTGYTFKVYTGVTNGPTSGTLAATATGTFAHAGYHTVPLPQQVTVQKGQAFSVVVNLNTPGYSYPIPFQAAVPGWSSQETGEPGVSFVSGNGAAWTDTTTLNLGRSSNMMVNLKAFAGPGSRPQTQTLKLAESGTGTGTVTSSPAGINCGSTCSATFAAGASVTLTAAAKSDSTFAGWSGACTGSAATCTVKMSADQSVGAKFTLLAAATAPTFAPAGASYGAAQWVTLSTTTTNATIYYTTNGSTPSSTSTKYTGPIAVSATETIKAIATASNFTSSTVAAAGYTLVASPVVLTGLATQIGSTGATLTAAVNNQGVAANGWFLFGASATALNTATPKQSLGASASAQTHTAAFAGKTKTTYYFQPVVQSVGGTTYGAVQSFKTN
ncbi:MAG: lectin like domain-containing protein [Terracidiphilus sp.]